MNETLPSLHCSLHPQATPYLSLQLLMDHLPEPELASKPLLTSPPHLLCGLWASGGRASETESRARSQPRPLPAPMEAPWTGPPGSLGSQQMKQSGCPRPSVRVKHPLRQGPGGRLRADFGRREARWQGQSPREAG